MAHNFYLLWPSFPYLLEGACVTLFYTLTSLVGGMVGGGLLTFFKLSSHKSVAWLGAAYTSVFRGTPLMLQLGLVYYGSKDLTGYDISVWQAGILTFSLNSSAYISEILRAGILSVDKRQIEAAHCLGVSRYYTMRDLVLPQVFRHTLPALLNECIDLLKESSLVSTITASDLMRRATLLCAQTHLYFEPYLMAGIIYYVLVMLLASLSSVLQKKLMYP